MHIERKYVISDRSALHVCKPISCFVFLRILAPLNETRIYYYDILLTCLDFLFCFNSTMGDWKQAFILNYCSV